MTYQSIGRVIGSVGGRFTVYLHREGEGKQDTCPLAGKTVVAQARGVLRRRGELLVGDLVEVRYDNSSFSLADGEAIPSPDGTAIAVERICERKNALIRPPMANLDVLFVTLAAASPDPVLETVDKLISIAEFHGIEPVVVVTKRELAPEAADAYKTLYARAGFSAFALYDCFGVQFKNKGRLGSFQDFIRAAQGNHTIDAPAAVGDGNAAVGHLRRFLLGLAFLRNFPGCGQRRALQKQCKAKNQTENA